MRIVVIGAGGTGGLYGGLLARAGHDVRLLARGAHLQAIRERGLEVRSVEFGNFVVQAPASDNPADLAQADADLVLFAVKTYDLATGAAATQQVLAPTGSVLTLQNGLDAPDRLAASIGAARVLIGTTVLETTILEPGVIGHLSPFHQISVSAFDGPPTPAVQATAAALTQAGIRVSVLDDGRRALWAKAISLIPMATLTSLCRAPIGAIRDEPTSEVLIDVVLDEVNAVAQACGYSMPDARERAAGVLHGAHGSMKASLARDFERGGPTELDAILGALVRLADSHGVPIPVTRAAYGVLKLREKVETGSPARTELSAAAL